MLVWRQNFPLSHHYNLQKQDHWDGKPSKALKVSNIWHTIRHREAPVTWASIVWHRLQVPRFSCHHWLIMHGRVHTLSKLRQFGITNNASCYFCINGIETSHHLFLECPFTQQMFKHINTGKCSSLPVGWADWRIELNNFSGQEIFKSIRVLIFQVGAYQIWRERNNRYHRGESLLPLKLAVMCSKIITSRLSSSKWFAKESIKHTALGIWSNNS
ncbi:hypothetical protein POM88_048043 [Heracleum sosnowskyi]|uniref:Reverse transcriptase zinc-binding domain-containing protein n=1 Tax=Heracleum sosnowskyi TaxID=360622 RepID=A0AAD8GT80_9APIA|nr:hypothetical protein POM88_048043 [Heracleum sosnowskyi]